MVEKFTIYHRELLDWNQRMNLISKRDTQRIVQRHFLDSLSACEFIPEAVRVLDIGAGAGFPGLPIKIIRPDVRLTLLEPRLKKFNFLSHIINILDLDVQLLRKPAEEHSGTYEIAIARKVGNLKWFTKTGGRLITNNGCLITYKGSRFEDEFREIQGWKILNQKPREFTKGSIVMLTRKNIPAYRGQE